MFYQKVVSLKKYEEKIVATGTWYYDKTIPKRIVVYTVPAEFCWARYNDEDELEESRPVPVTPDGLVYKTDCGGEKFTLKEIKLWADTQPWGPCEWD